MTHWDGSSDWERGMRATDNSMVRMKGAMTDADGADWPPRSTFLARFLEEVMDTPAGRLQRRRDRTEAHLVRLDEQLAILERFPDHDPHRDGDVVRFTLRWSRVEYTYAAVKAAGRWYTSSTTHPQVHESWLDFVTWMTNASEIVAFEAMVPGHNPLAGEQRTLPADVDVFRQEQPCPKIVPHGPHAWRHDGDDQVWGCGGRVAGTSAGTVDTSKAGQSYDAEASRREYIERTRPAPDDGGEVGAEFDSREPLMPRQAPEEFGNPA